MENENGQFMFLNRSFNPAGVPFKEGSESIIVSMFKPKTKTESEQPPMPEPPDDDIPF